MTRLDEIKAIHYGYSNAPGPDLREEDIEWIISRVEKLHEALDQIWRIQAKNFHGNDSSSIMADVARAALEEE